MSLSLARRAMDPDHLLHVRLLFTLTTQHETQIEAPFCIGCVGTTERPR